MANPVRWLIDLWKARKAERMRMQEQYEVEEIGLQAVDCFEIDRPNRRKSFDHGDLFCVDADDGLWQETEER